MKINQIVFVLFVFFMSSQAVFSQDEPRYEMILNTEYSGIKNKIKLTNIAYSLSNYLAGGGVEGNEAKPDPIYVSVTTTESMNKDFLKFFENFKRKMNGFIEIKDNYGKNPTRKIEFKNAMLLVSENISTYSASNSTNISIYSDSIVIDGSSIYSK